MLLLICSAVDDCSSLAEATWSTSSTTLIDAFIMSLNELPALFVKILPFLTSSVPFPIDSTANAVSF